MATNRAASTLLARVMSRHRVTQAFLFDSEGDSFWPAQTPLSREEVTLLGEAIDLINDLDARLARPFIGHDPRGRFSVTAMDQASDLFLVCLFDGPDRMVAEQTIEAMRSELQPLVANITDNVIRLF